MIRMILDTEVNANKRLSSHNPIDKKEVKNREKSRTNSVVFRFHTVLILAAMSKYQFCKRIICKPAGIIHSRDKSKYIK